MLSFEYKFSLMNIDNNNSKCFTLDELVIFNKVSLYFSCTCLE